MSLPRTLFGVAPGELLAAAEVGKWKINEGGGYWAQSVDDESSVRACWATDHVALRMTQLVPIDVSSVHSAETLRSIIGRCYFPGTASNRWAVTSVPGGSEFHLRRPRVERTRGVRTLIREVLTAR